MNSKKNTSNFSNKLNRLEEIYNTIKEMEVNDLEKLIEIYQEGIQLSKTLSQELNFFEQKIIEIKENMTIPNSIPHDPPADDQETAVVDDNIDFSERTEEPSTPIPESPDTASSTKGSVTQEYIVNLFSDDDE